MSLLLLLSEGGSGSIVPVIGTDGAYSPDLGGPEGITFYLQVATGPALDEDQTFKDLSPLLRAKAGGQTAQISIDRGRDTETDRFKPATLSTWVDNSDRLLDTTNTASPYKDCLKARRQIALLAHRGPASDPVTAPITLYRGFVKGWPRSYMEANQTSIVRIAASDGTRIAEQSNLTEGGFTLDDDDLGLLDVGRLIGTELDEELSGPRVEAIADAIGWPTDLRDIAEGVVIVGQQDARSGADALGQVEAAEDGATYFDEAGVLTHYDRLAVWTEARQAVSQVTIGPGGDIGYVDIDGVGIDDARIRNDISRTGLSGIEQTATDMASVADYGWSSKDSETIIAVRDGDVAGIVQTRIRRYAQPVERITSITLDVIDADLADEVLERRVLDRITVLVHPPGGDPYPPAEVIVQGIKHDITPDSWTATYRLGPVPTEDLFTLDDDLHGLLDSEALLAP